MEQDRHPRKATLLRFVRGRAGLATRRAVARHLEEGCEQCQNRILELLLDSFVPPVRRAETAAPPRVVPRAPAKVVARSGPRGKLERGADELRELTAQPVQRWQLLIRNSPRFQTPALCRSLLEESHKVRYDDPARMVVLAEAAVAVAEQIDLGLEAGEIAELKTRAWASLANAYRVADQLEAAETAMARAQTELEPCGPNPLLEAWVLELVAALRTSQRRLAEALEILDEVQRIYEREGERHLLGRTLITKGTVHHNANRGEDATRMYHLGLSTIDFDRDINLAFATLYNMVCLLVDLGRYEDGLRFALKVRPLCEENGDRLNLLRLRWLEARASAGLGELDHAERTLLEVRHGFASHGLDYHVALVTLDLATVFLRQGRTRSVRVLVDEMLAVFRKIGIQREALAAVLLLRQAVLQERLTLGLLNQVAEYLRRAEQNPGLRFEVRED